jgi:hypothetical protein
MTPAPLLAMEDRSGQERWVAHFRESVPEVRQSIVPGYGQSASQTQYYQGGMGQLSGPGVAKVTDCSSQAPDADAYRRQECDAVNFVARNPQRQARFLDRPGHGSSDQSRQLDRQQSRAAIHRNQRGFEHGILPGGDGYDPRDFYDGNLHRVSAGDQQFVLDSAPDHGRSVSPVPVRRADADAEQCNVLHRSADCGEAPPTTTSATRPFKGMRSLSCRRGVSATVGFGQCTPGAWLGRTAFMDCSWCVDPYMAMNIFCGSDGHSYAVEPYRSYDGVNRYDYNWIGYPWDGSYGRFPVAVAPGQSVTDYYVSNLGFGCNLYVYFSVSCNSTTCTPSMRNVSSGCNSSGGTGTGAVLQLPMSKTVSSWTSNECATLQQRAR